MSYPITRRTFLGGAMTAGAAMSVGAAVFGTGENHFMSVPIIDVHSHPLFPAYLAALTEEGGARAGQRTSYGMALPPWSEQLHLDMQDQHGIAASLLSMPGVTHAMARGDGRSTARRINEGVADIVARHPRRFGGLAIVPMHDMDAALEEMAYALDVLKLDGVGTSTHHEGNYLGEAVYNPWFEEMNRRGVTLFVHPTAPQNFNTQENKINVAVLEFMFDSTRMVTNMVLSGAKTRFDKIQMIATHGGGTIPYLVERISVVAPTPLGYRDGPPMTPAQARAAIASFHYDLTAATSRGALNAMLDLVSTDHLMMGFDFPLMPAVSITPAITAASSHAGIGDGDWRKIARENALRLFPRLRNVEPVRP